MKCPLSLLKTCPLFSDIDNDDLGSLLNCLNARVQRVARDEYVFSAGDEPKFVGVVLSGGMYVIQEDYWGDRGILAVVSQGQLFGEAFSCAQAPAFPVSVLAREDSIILLTDCRRILTTCPSSCAFHTSLIRNLLKIMASNNIKLTRKMEHITKKTTREKVLSYLSECAVQAGKNRFSIPFNRQELADYLSVERSALSSTLGKMRRDGILDFHKNQFILKK